MIFNVVVDFILPYNFVNIVNTCHSVVYIYISAVKFSYREWVFGLNQIPTPNFVTKKCHGLDSVHLPLYHNIIDI